MNIYEVIQVEATCQDLNKLVKDKEAEGWILVPPILLQPFVFTNEFCPSPIINGQYTLTFVKKVCVFKVILKYIKRIFLKVQYKEN